VSSNQPRFILDRAPVVYAIAQVKFSAVELISNYIPNIQDALRKAGYPRLSEAQMTNIRFTPSGIETAAAPRWEFHNRDRTAGIVISKDAVAVHVSKYSDFDQFCGRLKVAMGVLKTIVEPDLIERIGLRYVDVIFNESSGDYASFVHPGLLGLNDCKIGVKQSSCLVNYVGQTDVGTLSIRALQRNDGGFMPPDLYPNTLNLSETGIKPGQKVMTLDLDHFSDHEAAPVEFSEAEALARLWRLHDNLTLAFTASTTNEAWAYWGKRDRS
jgi:uncharacterized protein (TIGR04255 family)